MELRLFPTHKEAVAAFDAERGRAHDFRRLEVLKGNGVRVKFASIESLRNAEYLLGYSFNRVWVHENCNLDQRRHFLALIRTKEPVDGTDAPAA